MFCVRLSPWPNHALQRTRRDPEESDCNNPCVTAEEIEQYDFLNTTKLGRGGART
jgi:hypothetical protein